MGAFVKKVIAIITIFAIAVAFVVVRRFGSSTLLVCVCVCDWRVW